MTKNGKPKKLEVVTNDTAAKMKAEAQERIMDAQYLRWIRLTANDTQLLELRNELRAWRVNGPANHEAHETLKTEYMTILRMLGYTMHLLDKVADLGELSITEEDLNHIGGKHLNIELNFDKTGWYISLKDKEGETK